jgi:hypothetical protein
MSKNLRSFADIETDGNEGVRNGKRDSSRKGSLPETKYRYLSGHILIFFP